MKIALALFCLVATANAFGGAYLYLGVVRSSLADPFLYGFAPPPPHSGWGAQRPAGPGTGEPGSGAQQSRQQSQHSQEEDETNIDVDELPDTLTLGEAFNYGIISSDDFKKLGYKCSKKNDCSNMMGTSGMCLPMCFEYMRTASDAGLSKRQAPDGGRRGRRRFILNKTDLFFKGGSWQGPPNGGAFGEPRSPPFGSAFGGPRGSPNGAFGGQQGPQPSQESHREPIEQSTDTDADIVICKNMGCASEMSNNDEYECADETTQTLCGGRMSTGGMCMTMSCRKYKKIA